MFSWTERMASVVAACGPRQTHPGLPFHRRLEKVKFGVPLDQVCKGNIPGPLLVMLLKLNKEGPFKKDVFRAPGHQGNMKKLIHFLQQGRLVNIHNFSVNTIASVLKKFLRKLPGGIFGPENEAELFKTIELDTDNEKLAVCQKVISSLPVYSQHLLVLLFGTFRVIHSNSERAKTGMTAEALGVSVAPSFFHTCVSEGKLAKPEEVQKFKLATKITTFFIQHFGMRDLFGRENYEYYARLTGRILKVEDEWIFFTRPFVMFGGSPTGSSASAGGIERKMEASFTGQQKHITKYRRDSDPSSIAIAELSAGASALVDKTGSLEIISENCPLDPNGRLSISLEDQNVSSPSSCASHSYRHQVQIHDFRYQKEGREPKKKKDTDVGRDQDAKIYTGLPQVHQRQTERMRHRSEWFLSDPTGMVTVKCRPDRPVSLGTQQLTTFTSPPSSTGDQPFIRSTTNPPLGFTPLTRPPLSPLIAIGRASSATGQSSRLPPSSLLVSPFSCLAVETTISLPVCGSLSTPSRATSTTHVSSQPSLLAHSEGVDSKLLSYVSHSSFLQGGISASQLGISPNLRLRRRLSDRDKERRLVRRSSSKRKNKENGCDSAKISASSGSLDKSGAASVGVVSAVAPFSGTESGPSSLGLELPVATATKPRNVKLKRAGSADAGKAVTALPSARGIGGHPTLCRTASQDSPRVEASATLRKTGSVTGFPTSALTRSLPRI